MEKLLLIAIPDTAGVEQIAGKLRLRTVTVAPENYGKSLGSLAGYAAGTVPVSAETTLPETGLLVMCGLKNSRMDKLLAALRTAGIRIPPQGSPYANQPELERLSAGAGAGTGAPGNGKTLTCECKCR